MIRSNLIDASAKPVEMIFNGTRSGDSFQGSLPLSMLSGYSSIAFTELSGNASNSKLTVSTNTNVCCTASGATTWKSNESFPLTIDVSTIPSGAQAIAWRSEGSTTDVDYKVTLTP